MMVVWVGVFARAYCVGVLFAVSVGVRLVALTGRAVVQGSRYSGFHAVGRPGKCVSPLAIKEK